MESVVEVNLPSKSDALILQAKADLYGVEFNDHYLRKNSDGSVTVVVIGTAEKLENLADAGYDLGAVIEGPAEWRENMAERQAMIRKEDRAQAAALGEQVSGASHEDEIVILRVDYFENAVGRFLSVEAKTRLGRALPGGAGGSGYDPAAPTLFLAWDTGPGTPIAESPTRPMDTNIDPDTTPDTYIEHRELVRIGDAGTTTPPRPSKIRIGSSTGARADAPVNTWLGRSIPPSATGFRSDFTTRYMDPTEVLVRLHSLVSEYPQISSLIPLPNKTNGYQRRAQATMAFQPTTLGAAAAAGDTQIRVSSLTDFTVGGRIAIDDGANRESRTIAAIAAPNPPSPTPNVTLDAPLALPHASGAAVQVDEGSGNSPNAASQSAAVILTSTAWGHEGGNDTTAEFVDPGAPDSPLAVSVTGRSVRVSLRTDSTGALASTATEVIDAINSNPAARALVKATSYRGNAATGIAQPRARVNLSDFLTSVDPTTGVVRNAHVQRGPFQNYVLRIGKPSATPKVGVFLYCQQHAREWATPLTCLETASRLLVNYAIDPLTRELVDNLDIFILASSNPDGSHYSMYNNSSQRRTMTNHCMVGGMEADDPMAANFWEPKILGFNNGIRNDPASRNAWGVDMNRGNTFATLFDGYIGASDDCDSDVFAGPSEGSEPEIKNELWIADTFSNIKFSNNIHSFGGYFMWAPGAYLPNRDEGAADHANIGVEKYFFEAGDRILTRIKQHRNTVILPERTGPIADVLYSAAGNSADEHWYNRNVIAYSFETGADLYFTQMQTATAAGASGIRLSTNTNGYGYLKAGDTLKVDVGAVQEVRRIAQVIRPNPSNPNPNVIFTEPLTLPHAAGARIEGAALQTGVGFQPDYTTEGKHEALEFANGNYGLLESALAYARDNAAPQADMTGPRASRTPIDTTFVFVNEPSVIRYTMDGSAPTSSSPAWDSTGPREPGQVFHISTTTTFRWLATDIKGNTSTGSARFAIDNAAPTTNATVEQNRGFATVILSANDAVSSGGSGVAETKYRVDGGPVQTYSGPFSVLGEGSHTVEYYSVDEAGNTEATKSITFEVRAGRAPVACRVVLQPSKLRAREPTRVRVTVKLAGRAWEGARVALRGPRIARALTTNAEGMATASVTPTRAGTLRATVRANDLTNGCRDSSRVQRAARARVAGTQASGGSGGAALTGRPR